MDFDFGPFHKICNEPYAEARAVAAGGRKVAGFLCTYAPEELLYAAGYLPVRVLGVSASTQHADGLLQSFSCSLARAALEAALGGQLDFINLMVFPHTCDTIQNLTDIWMRHGPAVNYVPIETPVGVSGELAVQFYQKVLARFRERLESSDGPLSNDQIQSAIDLYSRHRSLMQRLYALRRQHPSSIRGKDMAAVAMSSFFVDRADHLTLIEPLILAIEHDKSPRRSENRPQLLMVGAACQLGTYVEAIEEAGCVIVDDDLCTGSRAFALKEVSCDDPIESLARMYLSRPPCPSKHCQGYNPGSESLYRAKMADADGVIFLLTKFCDPWAFDYPAARDALEQAGIPSLLVEIEQHQPPTGQFHTRVAAFVETLRAHAHTEAL